jgi:hypothetical protein
MSDIITKTSLDADGKMHVQREQDVSGILKQNKTENNDDWNKKDLTQGDTWGRKVATIPLVVLEMWAKEWGVHYTQLLSDPDLKAKMMARLNEDTYQHLRTHNSRI